MNIVSMGLSEADPAEQAEERMLPEELRSELREMEKHGHPHGGHPPGLDGSEMEDEEEEDEDDLLMEYYNLANSLREGEESTDSQSKYSLVNSLKYSEEREENNSQHNGQHQMEKTSQVVKNPNNQIGKQTSINGFPILWALSRPRS